MIESFIPSRFANLYLASRGFDSESCLSLIGIKFVDMFVMVLGQINCVSFVFETLWNKKSKFFFSTFSHSYLLTLMGKSLSPNHHTEILSSCVIINLSPYRHLSHLVILTCGHSAQFPIPLCAPTLGKLRFSLHTDFITWGLQWCLLGFWSRGQNPTGAIIIMIMIMILTMIMIMILILMLYT